MDATLLSSQPETYPQLIKRSFKLYQIIEKKGLLLALVVAVLVSLPSILSAESGFNITFALSPFGRLGFVIANIASIIFFIALLWHIHGLMQGTQEKLKQDFAIGLKKVIPVLVAAFIEALILFSINLALYSLQMLLLMNRHLLIPVILILFVQMIVSIYICVFFFFYFPIIATENKGVLEAIESSARIVWGNWWRTVIVQFTPWLSYCIVLMALQALLHLNFGFYLLALHTPPTVLTSYLHACILTIFIPWSAALLLVQLRDLELRKKT